ncbi:MAG: hypothetical protein FJW21_07545 [Acidimicrobiia bacterium]|nr:hypothetical protein [Acidimicrobiia bacterium]
MTVTRPGAVAVGLVAALWLAPRVEGQQGGRGAQTPPPPPTLGLEDGTLDFDTLDFTLKLVKASQTIAALEPKGVPTYTPTPTPPRGGRGAGAAGAAPTQPPPPPQPTGPLTFDFTPADRLAQRAANDYHHLGDLTFKVRQAGTAEWKDYDTARDRKPVAALTPAAGTLASSDLAATLPADVPLRVTRHWALVNGKVVLRFEVTNRTPQSVEIGALGIPVVFNNLITGRNLEQAHEITSFFDPAIAQDAGFVQVTRLSGKGPALVVVPHGRTPLEGWRPVDDRTPRTQTSEAIFEWMAHTKAYAENEWKNAQPWQVPTHATLAPGQTRTYGLEFHIAPEIRAIEDTLVKAGRPVAAGFPGYVAPMDQDLRLFARYGSRTAKVSVSPSGALEVTAGRRSTNGWREFTVRGRQWGRARLTLTWDDGAVQAINYYVTKPAAQAVADLGNFLLTKQWFDKPDDPFKRSPSVMSYDRSKNAIVEQDHRAWIAGLSDEGGAGSWLAAAMKQFGQPSRAELGKYERFVNEVLWGRIQYSDGERKYGVRKSLFMYVPEDFPNFTYDPSKNWTTWASWNRAGSETQNRAYNYAHVVAAYWSMYRIARNTEGLVTTHPWDWYLNQAHETMMYMTDAANRVGYVNVGLMGATTFAMVLEDMKREGWTEKSSALEARMKTRADRWAGQSYPYGSEMAWDSTGQEEVFAWMRYFGYDTQATTALNSIVGYMPLVPHWGYNGAARRYWDFIYAGAPGAGYERQLHHYGSGLNAIPALTRFRDDPQDLHLLRIGYAGTMGALTNIDEEGFASVAFHAFPEKLHWDAYSGDYGPNFLGHALNTGMYLINHPEFGWQAFGGNATVNGSRVTVKVADSFRQRIYLAPVGLYLTLDAGQFEQVEFDAASGRVRVTLASSSTHVKQARLRVEQTGKTVARREWTVPGGFTLERGAYTVPLTASSRTIEVR